MPSALAVPSDQPTPLWALAAASYLARYSGNTLRSYTESLRLLFTWCTSHGLDPLDAKRVHLELFVRYLETERRNIPRSVAHHLTPVFGYYRFAVVDDYVKSDPTVLLRRPKVSPRRTAVTPLRGAPEPAPWAQTSPGSSRSTRARCSASSRRRGRSPWSSRSSR